ncbi:iron chelate uptake ABC transporter family permease subunit, partial [Caulobacter sp.]|uniref:iron chelate uptake ABC transporter family permease subunit n=1 Tax=Caulobacter sp. TaxID=78 RepID=UPI003BB191CF
MSPRRLEFVLLLVLGAAAVVAIGLGESPLSAGQYHQALSDPASPPGEVLWAIRLPRVLMAALVGAGLGLAGATMQG